MSNIEKAIESAARALCRLENTKFEGKPMRQHYSLRCATITHSLRMTGSAGRISRRYPSFSLPATLTCRNIARSRRGCIDGVPGRFINMDIAHAARLLITGPGQMKPIRSIRFELVDPPLLGFGESATPHNAYQDAVSLRLKVLDHERRTRM